MIKTNTKNTKKISSLTKNKKITKKSKKYQKKHQKIKTIIVKKRMSDEAIKELKMQQTGGRDLLQEEILMYNTLKKEQGSGTGDIYGGGKQYYYGSHINHKGEIKFHHKDERSNNITPYKWLALISASNIKHFPFIYRIFNKKAYIIENSKNGLDNLKNEGYLYTLTPSKVRKKEYYKYFYQTDESIKNYKKKKINNIYDELKNMNDVIMVPYEYFIRLIVDKLPDKKSPFNSDYIWHGSPIDIKGYIEPRHDGFEETAYIYGCINKSGALLFSVERWGTDVLWDGYYNYTWTMETEKNAFDVFKKKSGYVYQLNKDQFIEEKYPTYITDKKAKILKKIKIKDVWREINKQKDNIIITYTEFKRHIINYQNSKHVYSNKDIEIVAKTKKEKRTKYILQTLLESYNIPIYHNKVIIKENAQSLSFPDITIKQTTDIMELIYLFIHENLHIAVSLPDKEVKKVLDSIKKDFPDWKTIGSEFEVWSQPPWNFNWLDNFAVHMAVIYNSILMMKDIFPKEYREFFYNGKSPYKKFEIWLMKNPDKVEIFLKKHNLLFQWKPKRPETISFPAEEWLHYKHKINKGKSGYTVRVSKEYGKYKQDSIYYHPYIGTVKITKVVQVNKPDKDIPWWNTIPKHFQDEIIKYAKGKMEWLSFIKY